MNKRTIFTVVVILILGSLSACSAGMIATPSTPDQESAGPADTTVSTPAVPPAVSEGGRIVFYSGRNVNSDIYTMAVDGSDLQRLTDDPADDDCPAFSPYGRQIVFSSKRDGNYELYVMESNGNNVRRLTNTPASEIQAAFSPDGKFIVYDVYNSSNWDDGDVFVMNSDGTNVRQLTASPQDDTRPDFSPDGSKIFFSSKRDGNFEIYSMDADGKNQTHLTNTEQNELFPQVSPDGEKIAYAVVVFGLFTAEIQIMNIDGSEAVTLVRPGSVNENPMWSPDGSYTVFQSNRDGNYEVYIMDADNSNPRRLTTDYAWDGWAEWGRE